MSDFFPDEIVVEILQRLPTKSLIQFRTPYVTSKYMHLRRSRNLVICIVKSNFSKKGISPHHTSYQKEILLSSPDLELHVRGKICPTFAHPLPQTLPMR
ncbi:uncharacterized protein LOC114284677 isoform X2 [Camellia sinensis]|uniref:uncharacterized protein LOC114284677 isoform X2 n=1 Tax=Camellia sinensis TaxID=4442 RepID=UPI001035A58B|nr:uncharacterized protein LOC114284677 isoform X2 [Camellia sinensis]